MKYYVVDWVNSRDFQTDKKEAAESTYDEWTKNKEEGVSVSLYMLIEEIDTLN